MKSIVTGFLCLFAVTSAIAGSATAISQSTKSLNDLLLPELTRVLDAINEHNRKIDEKTDTFVEAFIHYNFSRDRYVDETPYRGLQLEVERAYRLARVVEAISMMRERAVKSGRTSATATYRPDEQRYLRDLRSSLEKVLADTRNIKLKVDMEVFERLATEVVSACSTYAEEIGLQAENTADAGVGVASDRSDAGSRIAPSTVSWGASRGFVRQVKDCSDHDLPVAAADRERAEAKRAITRFVERVETLIGIAETAESGIATTPTRYQGSLCQTVIDSASRIQLALAEFPELRRYLPSMETVGARETLSLCEQELSGKIAEFSRRKTSGEPGATDNPDDAQRLREDH